MEQPPEKPSYGLKPANDSLSPRLQQALARVRLFQQREGDAGRDKLEIIVDLMRGPNGATVEDVVGITGWPLEIVRSTLTTLTGIVDGGEAMTLVNEQGTKQIYRITGWDETEPSDV